MNDDANLPTPADGPSVKALAPASSSPAERQERMAAWIQFPRRVVFLLITFGLAQAVLSVLRAPLLARSGLRPGQTLDWSRSLVTRAPVAQMVGERLPNTMLLLIAALILAALLAALAVLVAVLVHKLEDRIGPLGSVLKGLGRLAVFGKAVAPTFVLAVFFILILAVQLKWLPAGGMFSVNKPNDLGDRIRYLILPVLTLALLPAMLTAQATAREVTLPRERTGIRLWLTGLFKMLGTLLGQIGGLLGATMLVETVFAWPGVGRLLSDYTTRRDYPVLLGVLSAYAGLVLVGRLMAEFFRWLERLVRAPLSLSWPQPSPWRRKARTIWVIVTLALLVAPLALVIVGLTVDQNAATKADLSSRLQPPSANHLWGTDAAGRDVRARVLRGSQTMVGLAALAAAIAFLPGLLGGALTGWLASRHVWWTESAADLLLMPADVMLFIPAVPAGVVMMVLMGPSATAGLAVAVVLLPRAVRLYQTLWAAAPLQRKALALGLAGPGVLLLGGLFTGLGLSTALEFAGFGVRPPNPTLGGMLAEAMGRYLTTRPAPALASGIAIWICAFAFYIAADALVGFFHSKEALARLNE